MKKFNKETKDAIYFYTPKYYFLDNFSAYKVKIWGKLFSTSEHAFQWKKFSTSSPKIAKSIFYAKSARETKIIAIKNKDKVLPVWHKQKVKVMEEILRAKTKQHESIKEKLKKTRKKLIIENSPTDNFWGIGPDGKGENMVGKIWMKIRDDKKLK